MRERLKTFAPIAAALKTAFQQNKKAYQYESDYRATYSDNYNFGLLFGVYADRGVKDVVRTLDSSDLVRDFLLLAEENKPLLDNILMCMNDYGTHADSPNALLQEICVLAACELASLDVEF